MLPFIIALASALVLPKLIKKHVNMRLEELKILIAAILPLICVVGYFWALDALEYQSHVAEDPDGGFMGPLALLLIGFPIFGPMIAIACFLAVLVYKDS